jgi:hypothetical protein
MNVLQCNAFTADLTLLQDVEGQKYRIEISNIIPYSRPLPLPEEGEAGQQSCFQQRSRVVIPEGFKVWWTHPSSLDDDNSTENHG